MSSLHVDLITLRSDVDPDALEAAIAEADAVLARHPGDEEARERSALLGFALARLAARRGDADEAAAALDRALPRLTTTPLELAALLAAGRDLARAYERGLAARALRFALASRPADVSGEAAVRRMECIAALLAVLDDDGRGDEAASLAEAHGAAVPPDLEPAAVAPWTTLLRRRARTAGERGEPAAAVRLLEQALALSERSDARPAVLVAHAVVHDLVALHPEREEPLVRRMLERLRGLVEPSPASATEADPETEHAAKDALQSTLVRAVELELAAARRDEAERLLREAVAIERSRVEDPEAPRSERGALAARLAEVLMARGAQDEAERWLAEARDVAARRSLRPYEQEQLARVLAFYTPPGRDLPEAVRSGHALASPRDLCDWFSDPVTEPTLRDAEGRPARGGPLCEQIFGPERDLCCACGRLEGLAAQGQVCPACGVELVLSQTRTIRCGRIELATPVVHPWCAAGSRPLLAEVLGITKRELEAALRFEAWVVTQACGRPLGAVVDALAARTLRRIWGDDAVVRGTRGLREALRLPYRDETIERLTRAVDRTAGLRLARARRQLERLCEFGSIVPLEVMLLEVLPVLPPGLAALQVDRSRLHAAYADVVRCNRAVAALGERVPEDPEFQAAARALQAAVDEVFAAVAQDAAIAARLRALDRPDAEDDALAETVEDDLGEAAGPGATTLLAETHPLLQRLDAVLRLRRPRFHATLRAGASAAEIDDLEAAVGHPFPPLLRQLLAWAQGDGQRSFMRGWVLTTVRELRESWDICQRLHGDGTFDRADWFDPAWVPFLVNGAGDCLAVDLRGCFPSGRPGQVVCFWHDWEARSVEHPDLESWLRCVVEGMEADGYVLERDGRYEGDEVTERLCERLCPGYPKRFSAGPRADEDETEGDRELAANAVLLELGPVDALAGLGALRYALDVEGREDDEPHLDHHDLVARHGMSTAERLASGRAVGLLQSDRGHRFAYLHHDARIDVDRHTKLFTEHPLTEAPGGAALYGYAIGEDAGELFRVEPGSAEAHGLWPGPWLVDVCVHLPTADRIVIAGGRSVSVLEVRRAGAVPRCRMTFAEAELDDVHALRCGQILVGTRSDETAVVLGIHDDRIRVLGEVVPEGDHVVVDADRLFFVDTTTKQAHELLGLDERFAAVFGATPRSWPG